MWSKIKRIDYLGSITLVSGVALLLVGLSVGGNQYAWSDPLTWGTVLGGLGGITLFLLVEKFVAREPILAPRILFSRTPGFVSLTNWFASMYVFPCLFLAFRTNPDIRRAQFGTAFALQSRILELTFYRHHLPGTALLFGGRRNDYIVCRSAPHSRELPMLYRKRTLKLKPLKNAIFASTASLLGGIYMARTGKYKALLVISGVLAVIGPALMVVSGRIVG